VVCTISGTQSFDIDGDFASVRSETRVLGKPVCASLIGKFFRSIEKEVELDANNDNQVREPQRKITMLDRGRVVSKHAGALVYYDSRHRVFQTPLCGGFIGELVQELQPDGNVSRSTINDSWAFR
jgi:hypothetical protein